MPTKPNPKSLDQDDHVQNLVPEQALRATDRRAIPEQRTISGWLGKSTHQGYWRLYTTPELDEYIEIEEDDILQRRQIDTSVSPLGGSVLTIKASAEIHGMGATSVIARDAMLKGAIVDECAGKSISDLQSFMIGMAVNDKNYTNGFWCSVSMLFMCTTHVVKNQVCTLASGKLCGTRRFLP